MVEYRDMFLALFEVNLQIRAQMRSEKSFPLSDKKNLNLNILKCVRIVFRVVIDPYRKLFDLNLLFVRPQGPTLSP